jgi:hypothetical protein
VHPYLFNLCCCLIGQHSWVPVYDRPWRKCFRKHVFNFCLDCGVTDG